MKNTKNHKEKPLTFDLRQAKGWDQLQAKMPIEVFSAFLREIMACPCCLPHEKELARKRLETFLQ